MKKLFAMALGVGAIFTTTTAFADPVQISGDEGYSRLARWESHLEDVIASRVRDRSLDGYRAWRIQRDLGNIEIRVVQTYYQNGRIDYGAFRTYAVQLRNIGQQLNEGDWGPRNIYGNGWYDSDRGYGGDDRYGPPPTPPGNYYREGDYERSCRSGNVAAGTIFGALAGGLIGGAASHGNGGAIAGGVILGGLLGNTLSRDVDCDDQRYAFNTYGQSLNGDVGREYRWQHNANYGTFTSTREYRDGPYICRDFHTVTYRGDQRFDRDGTACRQDDGNWRFR
ncbi:MAG: hypothetical protein ISS15_05760 [Alphaproteobacteria bacterium]|nr:hypothetical protein [Alphaproteobacteria bacterium]MBL6939373.1 hypothetical protein [Alphaproteobacteria bacterium]MBL7097146.1 hypothetical protein [Alphaproteobacteria bacterium]